MKNPTALLRQASLCLIMLHCAATAWAAPNSGAPATTPEQVVASLQPQTGSVSIPQAEATVNLGSRYTWLGAQDAQRVLHDLWRNPPDTTVLGMILPGANARAAVVDPNAWAVVVTYVSDGYVSDADAGKIDFSEMLADMQKQTLESNPERKKQGYPEMELVGWAEQPHYDASTHRLYWARDIKATFADGDQGHSLNYGIRVLGRKGYLSLDAIAPIEQLAQVRADMRDVVPMATFDAGQRYADYKAGTDKVAEYGIAALIAGVAAKKLGLLAMAGVFFAKFFKVIAIAVFGGLAAVKRFFGGKSKTS